MKHLNSKVFVIWDQTLSASETADLVTSMRDRVERVVLLSDVTLDVETVDTRIAELRQGTCGEIICRGTGTLVINTENISPGGQVLSAGGQRGGTIILVLTNDLFYDKYK